MQRTLTIEIDEEIAARAADAGLLSNHEIERLLQREMRCQAARELMEMTQLMRDANDTPMTVEEVSQVIKEARKARRSLRATHP